MAPKLTRRQLLGAGSRAALGLTLCGPLRELAGGVVMAEAVEPQRVRGGAATAASGKYQAALARLDEFVARHMNEVGAPGMTLALADRAGTVRVSGYGFADTKRAARVRPETLFEIGSISKSVVSVALLTLRDEGKLDLKRPVSEYLPWLKVNFAHGPVNTHHLLSHTSGLPGVPLLPESVAGGLETAYAPGERFVYSNIGYFILGLLLEELDGRTLAEALRARVLQPLGMEESAPVITNAARERMAVGYAPLYEDRPFPPRGALAEAPWIEVDTAAGSVASTAREMVAYMRMLLNHGQGPRGRVISEESYQLLTKPAVLAPFRGEDGHYALGLWVSQLEGRTQLRHTGGMVAFSSMMDVDLTTGLAAFASVNANLSGYRPVAVTRYALDLLRAAHAGKPLPTLPAPPAPADEVKDAGLYAGTYTSPAGKRLVFAAEANRLLLLHAGRRIALERSGGRDSFVVRDPDFELFRLVFTRDGERVTEAAHGPEWYAGERYTGPRSFEHPKELDAYVGRYRHDSPWYGTTRVVLRKGQLWLDGEQPLFQVAPATFRLVPEGPSPEWVRFEEIADGRAMRMNFSTVRFFRAFTP